MRIEMPVEFLRSASEWNAVFSRALAPTGDSFLVLICRLDHPDSRNALRHFEHSAGMSALAFPHYVLDVAGVAEALRITAHKPSVTTIPAVLGIGPLGNVLLNLTGAEITERRLAEFIGGREFTVDARRLADHLVAGHRRPLQVVVRELLQNAVDACCRVRTASRAGILPEVRIDYRLEPDGRGLLSICDAGDGMSERQLYEDLLRVASSGTAQHRRTVADAEQRGFYGVGFLTALTVSTRVRIHTQSIREEEPAVSWVWTDAGQQGAVAVPRQQGANGTFIELSLESDVSATLTAEDLRRMVWRTARYVTIPVRYGDSAQRCNDLHPLWNDPAADRSSILRFCEECGETSPLQTFLLTASWDLPMGGLLFVPSRHQEAQFNTSRHAEAVDLYVRGLHVSVLDRDFLGEYHGLVGGVICDDALTPTLTRDSVRKDEVFTEHSTRLQTYLEGELGRVFATRPNVFEQMQQAFPRKLDELLKSSAVLRRTTAPHYSYSTSKGNRTFEGLVTDVFAGKPVIASLPASKHTLTNLILRENRRDYVQLERLDELELFARRCHDEGKRLVLSTDALEEVVMASLAAPLPRMRRLLQELEVMPLFVQLNPTALPVFAIRIESRWCVIVNTRCPQILALERHRDSLVIGYVLADLVTTSLLLSGRALELDEQVALIELKMEKLGGFLGR